MKTKLLTICLLLVTSQLSYGDEKIISCDVDGKQELFKHINGFFKDNILQRKDASWEDWCPIIIRDLTLKDGKELKGCKRIITREINESGGVCKEKLVEENTGDCVLKQTSLTIKYIDNKSTIDFLLNEYEQNYTYETNKEKKDKKNNYSCSVFKLTEE